MGLGNVTSNLLQRLLDGAEPQADSIPAWREAYRDAAAVLASFEPRLLQPFDHPPVPEAWHKLLADCEPVDMPFGPGRWRLRDRVRRASLRRLHTLGLLASALASNPDRLWRDPLQSAIEGIVNGAIPALHSLRREDLAAYGVAREWFDGILTVPSEDQLRAALPIAELVAPLQRLADGFVGRSAELAILEDYVGALDARSIQSVVRRGAQWVKGAVSGWVPLFVHGPGGVGKSTLIAKFVLEHFNVASELRLPFAYLDVDRREIDPLRPPTLLLEAMTQLRVEFPDQADPLKRLMDEVRTDLARIDPAEVYKGPSDFERNVHRFADWVRGPLAHVTQQPLVLVVDTFEEVQYLGAPVVHGVWRLLASLQAQIPALRIVVAGRVLPADVDCKSLQLSELDSAGARALLRRRLETDAVRDTESTAALSDRQLDEIIGNVGRSPMALRLAAQIVGQQGIDKLRSLETRSFLFLHLRTEKIQAQLYGRILAHIHDPLVRRLAYPGLVVRRITPEVILEVLAGPCEVPVPTPAAAEQLFLALEQEVALFQPDLTRAEEVDALQSPSTNDDPGLRPLAVRHRLDVRRIMLHDLLSRVSPETVRRIDEGAVAYYARQTSARARAEEIYHRLRLGQPLDIVEARWTVGAAEHLRSAPEELPPRARLWLMTHLGVTPPPELLALADLQTWEDNVARDAQRALESGSPAFALELLRSRQERTPTSPLVRLEAVACRLIGDNEAARRCALAGIQAAASAGEAAIALDLSLFVAEIDEGERRLDDAMLRLEGARALATDASRVDTLRLLSARIRVRRLLGDDFDREREALIESALALLDAGTLDELRQRPALLRELVAEVGDRHVELLREGLDVVGLELEDDSSRGRLFSALADWGRSGAAQSPITRALAAENVMQNETGRIDWQNFSTALGGASGIAHLLGETLTTTLAPALTEALSDVYRAAVNTSIKGKPDRST